MIMVDREGGIKTFPDKNDSTGPDTKVNTTTGNRKKTEENINLAVEFNKGGPHSTVLGDVMGFVPVSSSTQSPGSLLRSA